VLQEIGTWWCWRRIYKAITNNFLLKNRVSELCSINIPLLILLVFFFKNEPFNFHIAPSWGSKYQKRKNIIKWYCSLYFLLKNILKNYLFLTCTSKLYKNNIYIYINLILFKTNIFLKSPRTPRQSITLDFDEVRQKRKKTLDWGTHHGIPILFSPFGLQIMFMSWQNEKK